MEETLHILSWAGATVYNVSYWYIIQLLDLAAYQQNRPLLYVSPKAKRTSYGFEVDIKHMRHTVLWNRNDLLLFRFRLWKFSIPVPDPEFVLLASHKS
jgi:hypothetical protein